jgi:ADP-ribosyl-[dinitrogen reductase] hydrolase
MASEHNSPKSLDAIPESTIIDRAIGCLLGQSVGDALGTRYEFGSRKQTETAIAKDLIKVGGKPHLPILGGGPFKVEKGQVTDDTELALALARSLFRNYQYDVYDIAQSYTRWFKSPPFDIGNTTRQAFYMTDLKMNTPEENYNRIILNSQKNNQGSLSNGCLMRISPLAIAGAHWKLENLIEAAKMNCAMTNPNPVALDAVAVYVTAIRTAILTGDPLKAYTEALDVAQTAEVREMLEAAVDAPQPVVTKDNKIEFADGALQGYLGVAMQNAFYHLLYTESVEEALTKTVAMGGDTDTNGCICGALIGAVYGDHAIPEDWVLAVLGAHTAKRQAQFPDVKTRDLVELAVFLVGSPENHILEPQFHDDFQGESETNVNGEPTEVDETADSNDQEPSDAELQAVVNDLDDDDIYGPAHPLGQQFKHKQDSTDSDWSTDTSDSQSGQAFESHKKLAKNAIKSLIGKPKETRSNSQANTRSSRANIRSSQRGSTTATSRKTRSSLDELD